MKLERNWELGEGRITEFNHTIAPKVMKIKEISVTLP
jgi:hypothetical protein